MPKTFSDSERERINAALLDAATDSLKRVGVRKTTVDGLVKQARIPKGTFYLFYDSKELLLYAAIMRDHERLQKELAEKLISLADEKDLEKVTETIFEAFGYVETMGLAQLVASGELEVLMRKLPDELVRQHQSEDDDFLSLFLVLFPNMTENRIKAYSAAFRALFFTACFKREIGEEVYDDALRCCIRGLVTGMAAQGE